MNSETERSDVSRRPEADPHHPSRSPVVVQRLLEAIRKHLDLDVAFIGQFVDGERVFRYVDADPGASQISVFDSDPIEETYCGNVVAGRLPGLLPDSMAHPVSADLPITSALSIGSYLSVPIRFSDGRVYGTFCCFSHEAKLSLDAKDLRSLEMMADVASEHLEELDASEVAQRHRREVISSILDTPKAMTMAFQPLRELVTMEIVGLEALARFPAHDEGPEWFFREAADAGLGHELEMLAVRTALTAFDDIPPPIKLNINVSAETLTSEEFFETVSGVDRDRLVIEVTEHAAVEDYTNMRLASERLTELGIWLAIDDVGMGFSGLNRILESAPEQLKLDRVVVREVDTNLTKQAMIDAFRSFGERAGFVIVAEGIETEAELLMLRSLGVELGQGYHLGRPGPLDVILREREAGPA